MGHAHLWVTACDHCGSKLSVSDLALFYRWESEAWPGAGDRPGQLRSTLACLWVSLECQDHHLRMLLQDFISQRRNGIVLLQQELLGAFYSLSRVSPRGPQGWQALGPRRCVELAIPRASPDMSSAVATRSLQLPTRVFCGQGEPCGITRGLQCRCTPHTHGHVAGPRAGGRGGQARPWGAGPPRVRHTPGAAQAPGPCQLETHFTLF